MNVEAMIEIVWGREVVCSKGESLKNMFVIVEGRPR
jgi:hypothetical protein